MNSNQRVNEIASLLGELEAPLTLEARGELLHKISRCAQINKPEDYVIVACGLLERITRMNQNLIARICPIPAAVQLAKQEPSDAAE